MTDRVLTDRTVTPVNTPTTVYTAPSDGQGTIITAFTASNCLTSGVSYKAYITGGTADCAIIPFTIVGRDKFSPGSAIVGHTVPSGSKIQVENSASDGLNFYITGREQ
jgi:hypothetical protein